MTQSFEVMLRMFGCGALGDEYEIKDGIDVNAVISLAHSQGVWTVIYPVLSKICDIPAYRFKFLESVANYVRRNEFTLNVIKKISDAGIDVCLLKGAFVSQLYSNPDYRISGDTDVLINPSDEKKVKDILLTCGYTLYKRAKNDHHLKAKHPVGGLLEVHLNLYSYVTEKILFNGKIEYNEEYIETEIYQKKVKVLGINDNLNYLTAHYIKHFITGGASIRQMMDLLLYMKKYEDKIDFKKYDSLMRELRYDKLIRAVKGVGVEYFGMQFEDYDIESGKMILDDCEETGLFGKDAEFHSNIYSDFCANRKAVSGVKLKFINWFKYEQTIFDRIFPSKRVLIKRGYKYANNTFLVPFAWIHNIFDYVFTSKNKKLLTEEKSEKIKARKELVRRLDMIE
ncbi:MAG: nucleotidyltransferase family protein [Clostridia bacterium]|nr:nucleotidyltransferase family protein [Clostridia bacterium]